ncbi:MAG: hypothetical protein ACK4KW_13770 [Gemmobacter sp.]
MRRLGALTLCLSGLAACADGAQVQQRALPPAYLGIETRLLDDDLVNFLVAVRHAEDPAVVETYAACAAAQYALIRGYGFARHIRTTIAQQGSIARGDAVYTISPSLPRGVGTLDAEVKVRDCGARGIPTV